VLFLFIIILLTLSYGIKHPRKIHAVTADIIASPYLYNFNSTGTVEETGSSNDSSSPYWWVNSGGALKINGTRGSTIKGSLSNLDPWKIIYSANNPEDTDNGSHPQNIFRLITRSKWQDERQEAYFVIGKYNLSSSSNRNQSNGILLFNRYQDAFNLYYTGVRVDGSAIIKKKINGIYYTMAEVKNVFPGNYNHDTEPNLLTLNKWIGLRSEVTNQLDGTVKIKLYIDKGWTGIWQLVAEATDDGKQYGGAAIKNAGFGGIRTDFMDAEFENFRLREI
jgi:hypothetical protein